MVEGEDATPLAVWLTTFVTVFRSLNPCQAFVVPHKVTSPVSFKTVCFFNYDVIYK